MRKAQSGTRYGIRDSPFFRRRSRKKLADLLRVSLSYLESITDSERLYVRRWKHKKEDKWLKHKPTDDLADEYRPIDIPDPRLKAVQSRIANLLGRIAPPDFLFSPVKGRSYVDNAAHHLGANAFWLLDVADYFPSCTANNVARFFSRDLECSLDVTAVLVKLTTLKERLPQGSPCSPILAYFSNAPMWKEIEGLVQAADCKLSVYADDIAISGDVVPKRMIWRIKQIIHRHGLKLKPTKEVSLIAAPAEITGVIVRRDGTKLPNRKLKLLAELKAERHATRTPELQRKIDSQIAGRRAQRKQVES